MSVFEDERDGIECRGERVYIRVKERKVKGECEMYTYWESECGTCRSVCGEGKINVE